MSDNTTNELLRLKRKIEDAKAEKNRIEGELRSLAKAMLEEFGTDKVAEVTAKAAKLKAQADALRASIEKELCELKETLGDA